VDTNDIAYIKNDVDVMRTCIKLYEPIAVEKFRKESKKTYGYYCGEFELVHKDKDIAKKKALDAGIQL